MGNPTYLSSNGPLLGKLRFSQQAGYLVCRVEVPVLNTRPIVRSAPRFQTKEKKKWISRTLATSNQNSTVRHLDRIFGSHDCPNDPSLIPLLELPQFFSQLQRLFALVMYEVLRGQLVVISRFDRC